MWAKEVNILLKIKQLLLISILKSDKVGIKDMWILLFFFLIMLNIINVIKLLAERCFILLYSIN